MTSAAGRATSPVDQDLQNLYNEVWAGFSEEKSSAAEDLDTIYNVYGENEYISRTKPNGNHHEKYNFQAAKKSQPPPRPQQSTSSSQSGGFRRLPPTPGGSSVTSSPTTSFAMPEPEPYYDQGATSPRPSHYSVDSYTSAHSTELLRKGTATSTASRRLPSAPARTSSMRPNTAGERPPVRGNSTDPRPSTHHGNNPAPPPGALAPRIPGRHYSPELVGPVDIHVQDTDAYQPGPNMYDQIPAPSYAPGAPSFPPRIASHDNFSPDLVPPLPPVGYAASPEVLSPYDTNLARSASSQSGFFMQPPAQYASSQRSASINRGNSAGSYVSQTASDKYFGYDLGPSEMVRRPTDILHALADYTPRGPLELHDEADGEYWEDDEEDESRFVNFSLLSHIAVQLRDKVPRGTHVKGSIPYPRAFTGKDIVLAINHGLSTNDRRAALQVARSLQNQLFFYEVEWGGRVLQDGVEDVYMFLDDQEGGSDAAPEREELPTGVVTMLTRCYSPSCGDGSPCYAYGCPRKGNSIIGPMLGPAEVVPETKEQEWSETVEKAVLSSLPESEITRQTIIHKIIGKEQQYLQDLDIVESAFIKPIRTANPPVIPLDKLDDFIDDVFGNILDLRECNRRLLEVMFVRQREQAPIIQRIGDVFLDAATEFRLAYPIYIGHHPLAEKRMKDELEVNPEFRLFLEHCSRQSARTGDTVRLDLKHFLNRPSEHLQKYPVLLEAVLHETATGNPDTDYLREAIDSIKSLQNVAQLRTFQSAMGRGAPGKWEWHDMVSAEIRKGLSKDEAKRQSIIFELIKGEMAYVKDLENIEIMYIQPLRNAEPPIIPPNKLDQFIEDVFHNFAELHLHHRKLVEKFHEYNESSTPQYTHNCCLFDAALNFPAYRIDDEMARSAPFKTFVEQCVRHPDAHRLDMKSFINRPIPRLLRYELFSKKVELWRYNSHLSFKPGEYIDMGLLDPDRSLVYSGKLLRQPDGGLEWNGWTELFVLLFDNYLVLTKPKERDGITKYNVNRRPIPLDLLTLVNFVDPPAQRSTGLLRNLRGGERHADAATPTSAASAENPADARSAYPITLHHTGRLGGPYILYAETAQARTEWKDKLEHALGLRKIVQESNKVFEVEMLSTDTFLVPAMTSGPSATPSWNQEATYTGRVTCSVPFNTADGRGLVAIGCAEGVWIGFRHDPKSMRRVLHLKMVTQCAMLQEFGIFLVLADKALFAYHIEALVPSGLHSAQTNQVPQKLNGTKDVHFFSVGSLHGRTLIIYMKKKGLDSIFRVLEPVGDKINERVKAPVGLGSRLGFRSAKSEWFRIYRDFFLPSESFDLIFLKARIAILCAKGFEIMDLNDFNSVTIPQREDARLAQLAKRCESCRPLGMFRSTDDEFLLCYDEFGVYVDKHGDPSRSAATIEWEGTAERVALHSPYILLFDSRFIEVRHVETGRLAQIIPGTDVRCIWDGRGVGTNVSATGAHGREDMGSEAQVHVVMTPPVESGTKARAVAQHVVELVPTIPLFPSASQKRDTGAYAVHPGGGKNAGGYPAGPEYQQFSKSQSPPQSPGMFSMQSWRS
ncbi:CNH domain-containing protein [Infundibulicybe gibba]|nr:CNH domain-containing protein [Infundibulicybe gibba]